LFYYRCADYVKHLTKSTKEKEVAVEKAKAELEMKELKMEEDKANLEGRSDPESVASSLSAMTGDSRGLSGNEGSGVKSHKRKSADGGNNGNAAASKKQKGAISCSEDGSSGGSGSDEGQENGPGGRHNKISFAKMSSTVSDMTDSNMGSSESGDDKVAAKSSDTVPTTKAIVRGAGSEIPEHGHADVVVKVRKPSSGLALPVPDKLRNTEMTSLDSEFDLDYEEVFLSSNVPQLIATPAGRIVTCKSYARVHDLLSLARLLMSLLTFVLPLLLYQATNSSSPQLAYHERKSIA
jgi:hypothetical protein